MVVSEKIASTEHYVARSNLCITGIPEVDEVRPIRR
jgi:hypothetical protein